MTPTNALHWCGAALHATRDALGRVRLRCEDCDGVATAEAQAAQPTRAITQTPGAVCMAPLDPWDVPRFVPISRRFPHAPIDPLADLGSSVPRGVRFVPLTPTASPTPIAPLFAPERAPVRRRPDRPCDDCGTLVPQGTSGPISRQCDACCPPNTLERRGQRRRDAEAAGLCGACRAPLVQGACGRCEEVPA